MIDMDGLFERIDGAEDVDGLRLDIADAIAKGLFERRESLGYWEKAHFAQAIAALA